MFRPQAWQVYASSPGQEVATETTPRLFSNIIRELNNAKQRRDCYEDFANIKDTRPQCNMGISHNSTTAVPHMSECRPFIHQPPHLSTPDSTVSPFS
ncbi:hypothetical protein J1614_004780 [Plenodomus biglobosus]|nr:hypothetical protein J1614_004780 [Plenodomus biglobosus]